MADNTSYTSLFGHLIQEVKQYLSLQKEYVLMDTADKLIVILSSVAIAVVCFVLGAMALFFLTFALAHWIGAVTDNVPLGFLCIALFHLAILVLFFRNLMRIGRCALSCAGIAGGVKSYHCHHS